MIKCIIHSVHVHVEGSNKNSCIKGQKIKYFVRIVNAIKMRNDTCTFHLELIKKTTENLREGSVCVHCFSVGFGLDLLFGASAMRLDILTPFFAIT